MAREDGYRSFTVVSVGKHGGCKTKFLEVNMFLKLQFKQQEKLSPNYAVLRESEVYAL